MAITLTTFVRVVYFLFNSIIPLHLERHQEAFGKIGSWHFPGLKLKAERRLKDDQIVDPGTEAELAEGLSIEQNSASRERWGSV